MKSKWESDGESEPKDKKSKKKTKKKQKIEEAPKTEVDVPKEVPPPEPSLVGPSREVTEEIKDIDDDDEEEVIGEYPGGWKITTEVVSATDTRESIGISAHSNVDSRPFTISDIQLAEKEFQRQWKSRSNTIEACRLVDNYEKLHRINEGTYGVVYKAKDTTSGDIVALKRLKFDHEDNGFPITSLREISSLLNDIKHPHVVNVREIVVGSDLNQYHHDTLLILP